MRIFIFLMGKSKNRLSHQKESRDNPEHTGDVQKGPQGGYKKPTNPHADYLVNKLRYCNKQMSKVKKSQYQQIENYAKRTEIIPLF